MSAPVGSNSELDEELIKYGGDRTDSELDSL